MVHPFLLSYYLSLPSFFIFQSYLTHEFIDFIYIMNPKSAESKGKEEKQEKKQKKLGYGCVITVSQFFEILGSAPPANTTVSCPPPQLTLLPSDVGPIVFVSSPPPLCIVVCP
jgi:hypothetical protein